MKKYLLPFALCLLFASCDKKSKIEKEVEKIPVSIKVERFDKAFFETPVNELPKIKKQFPLLFPQGISDSIWINKIKDPIWREVYTEVQKKYPDFESEQQEIEDLFRHIKYYFPKTKIPRVITLINEMDYHAKAVYADSLVLISLELYLGRAHKFYEFPEYLKQNFEKSQIMPDIVSSFALSEVRPPSDKSLLSLMIYSGKELYLKDAFLPNYADADKIGYTAKQIKWCEENEEYMWRYFIENKMLYSSDSRLPNRFINLAPFSKFYLEIDNESPGRVGTWIGWQIVRSFMQNNEVSLSQLLQMDAVEIFNKSKYKPRK